MDSDKVILSLVLFMNFIVFNHFIIPAYKIFDNIFSFVLSGKNYNKINPPD